MKKKIFTRKPCWLFTDLRKQLCPSGHFRTEDDLYHAYVDWLDYYDPIGFVCNWGIRREYEPEAEDLSLRVLRCETVEEFTVELHASLTRWFHPDDLKPHFLNIGFRAVAEAAWALRRRFEHDMQNNDAWIASSAKLLRFKSRKPVGDHILCRHQLLHADGIDCQYRHWSGLGGTLDFLDADASNLTDAQLIERARTTGVIANDAEVRVARDDPGLVTVHFDRINSLHRRGSYADGPSPRRKKRIAVINVD